MLSYRVKLNKRNEYFRVTFNYYNTIETVEFTVDPKRATLFQPQAHIIYGHENPKIGALAKRPEGFEKPIAIKIGNIRCTEFNMLCYAQGIKAEDITVEEIDAPEQPLMTAEQIKQIDDEFKELKKAGLL